MKICIFYLICFLPVSLSAQTLQLHYDLRHSLGPELNSKNFPTLYFEYFKADDFGSFLMKIQSDLIGEKDNIGKFYMQVSKSLKFWEPKIYMQFQYSGGLGIAEPGQYGYYITNAFSIGASYPFQWNNAWFNALLCYTYNTFTLPSHDILFSFYWGFGLWNYKVEFTGNFDFYTLNKNTGDDSTKYMTGKWISLFGEPQFWYNLNDHFSFGTKINMYYHVLTYSNILQVYPTLAVKYKL